MNISTPKYNKVLLGRQGENLATKVALDTSCVNVVPGHPVLVHQRAGDILPYLCEITEVGNTVEWLVTSADTEFAGEGRLELRWYGENGELVKSTTYTTITTKSLAEPGEAPEVWKGYIAKVDENARVAQVAAQDAENAANAATESAEAAVKAASDAADSVEEAKKSKEAAAASAQSAGEAAKNAQSSAEEAKKSAEDAKENSAKALNAVGELKETVGENKAAAEKLVQDEAAARSSEDSKLDTKINELSNTVAANKTAANDAVSTEATVRQEADSALGKRIDDLKQEIGNLSNLMNFRGAVNDTGDIVDPIDGDVVVVVPTGKEYVYSDGTWVELGDTSAERKDITELQKQMETAEGDIQELKTKVDDLTVSDTEALELLAECGVITPAGTADGKVYTLNGKIVTI